MSSQSHFFVESGGFTQSHEQAFGPQSSTEFNLTSKFSLASPKKAHAICKGVVLVQPQTNNPDRVNLILRPYKQPFPGLNIKYLVYRGLQKSDFFTTGNNPTIIQKTDQTSYFINKINDDFNDFYNGNTAIEKPSFLASYIGYDEEKPSATLLSDLFFKESKFETENNALKEKDSFELPLIDSGKTLGSFAQGECGIDVVLNYGDYQNNFDNSEFVFDLNYARASEAKITLSGTDFNKKLQREQITQFVDIAAFYGLFVDNSKIGITDNGTITSKTGVAIYTDLLSHFVNKNKVYLYIQSNRNRSYNYYNNYQLSETNNSTLKIGIKDSLIETRYGNLDWPVHIFDTNQTNFDSYNDISLQLTASYHYDEIALYVLTGKISSASDRGFVTKENLLDPQNRTFEINFSQVLSFQVPNIDDNGQKKNISSLIRIAYNGKELDYSSINNYPVWVDQKRYLLYNNLFPNITIEPLFSNNKNFLITPVNKASLISYKVFSNLMNESLLNGFIVFQQGRKYIVNTDLSIETFTKEKVLFIAKKIETLDNFSIHKTDVFSKGIFAKKIDIDPNLIDNSNYFTSLYGSKDYNLKHYIVDDIGVKIKILSLDIGDQFDYCFYNLGITKEELNILKEIIPINSSNVDFHLQDNLDNPQINTETKAPFFKFSLGIIYENSEGILSTLMPQNPIYVYGFSNRFLSSKEYSEYEEKSINIQQYEEYNEIDIAQL